MSKSRLFAAERFFIVLKIVEECRYVTWRNIVFWRVKQQRTEPTPANILLRIVPSTVLEFLRPRRNYEWCAWREYSSLHVAPCDFFPSRLTGERTNVFRFPFPSAESPFSFSLFLSPFLSLVPGNIDLLAGSWNW